MTLPRPLFPGVLAEMIVISTGDRVRVATALHHEDVDVKAFLAVAIIAILEQASERGILPQEVIDEVTRRGSLR